MMELAARFSETLYRGPLAHQNIFPILLFLRSLAHGNIMCRGVLLLYTAFRKIYKTVMAIKSFFHVELFI